MWTAISIIFLGSIGLNLIMYAFAYFLQSDKLTDLSYATSFFIINLIGFLLSEKTIEQTFIFILVTLWSFRIGSYLFVRILKIGRDKRFDEIRSKPLSFLGFWLMQGITCAIVLIPTFLFYTQNFIPHKYFGLFLLIAFLGLLLETLADHQKFAFKNKHPEQFMSQGLWKKIRHPNYTGELIFWWGLFFASFNMQVWYLALVSPLWISFILLKFSGIPILQRSWEKRYGHLSSFKTYQKQSWKLIPFVY